MKLVLISNYGDESQIIADMATKEIIHQIINSLDWNDFYLLNLEKNDNDYISVGGNLKDDGLSVFYQENNDQYVIKDAPGTITEMENILISYLNQDDNWKNNNEWQ